MADSPADPAARTADRTAQAHESVAIPFEAGWPHDLQHRPDPNRVGGRRTSNGPLARLIGGAVAARPRASRQPGPVDPRDAQGTTPEPSYYDISMLKAPLWRWEIAWYFFLGGLSAGAFTIGRLADRHGDRDTARDIGRAASYTALAAFLPCPPLLIHDLGDPKRFHHMLRVWKPSSPMNLGTWAILGYSGLATAEAFRQYMLDRYPPEQRGEAMKLFNGFVELLHDAAGIPFALLVAGYTGVLLSSTANPLWAKNKWLGPLFSAGAVATGAAATSLALSLTARGGGTERSHRALERVDTAAHVVEAACLAGFLKEAGPKADALRRGRMKGWHTATIGGLVASELLKLLPLPRRAQRTAGVLSSLLSLFSGFALRWAMVHGGREAAADPHTARLNSRPKGP